MNLAGGCRTRTLAGVVIEMLYLPSDVYSLLGMVIGLSN